MAAPMIALQVAAQVMATRKGRAAVITLVVLVVLVPTLTVLASVSMLVTMFSGVAGGNDAVATDRCLRNTSPVGTPTGVVFGDLNADQVTHAETIIGVAKSITIPGVADQAEGDTARQHAARIALATAMQESTLTNVSGGDRDSVGLFQQRPSMGWGTKAQIGDPTYAATAFYYGAPTNPGLVDVAGWATMPVTVAAQAVQRSAFPDAYAKWEPLATELVAVLWDVAPFVGVHPDLDRPDLATSTGPGGVTFVPGGDPSCGGTWTPGTGADTSGTYTMPTGWGGYRNGRIPLSAMCVIPFASQHLLRCDATEAIVALNEAWKADHGGQSLPISSSYRTYERQEQLKREKGALAATPGQSNHGWGLAVDFGGFGGVADYSDPDHQWMVTHGWKFGWVHPTYMRAGGSGPLEPWHFEFMAAQGVEEA